MKNPLNRNRILAYLRASAGCAFFAAAAALAFVAATTNVVTTHDAAATKRASLSKSSVQDSIAIAAEKSAKDGSFQSPLTRAEEEAAKRAYPADETPFTAQLNAIIGVRQFLATSASAATPTPVPKGRVSKKNRRQPPEPPRFNTWRPTGPFLAQDPNVLTFSGATYNTSGRITALALDTASGCTASFCRLWVGAAGGGVWRTENALASTPTWTFLTSLNVMSNAIGTITYDNAHVNPVTGNAPLYVGTGEPNASADSEAGLGLMRSTDGGDTFTQVPSSIGPITTVSAGTGSNGTYTGNAFAGRAISGIVVDPTNPNILYVSSARGVRGVDSTYGGPTSNPPVPRPPFGLFKSTDAGAHFSYIFDGDASCGPGTCLGGGAFSSIRGVHEVELDPTNHNIVYAGDFPGPGGGGGIWRSNDGGATWTQIKTASASNDNVDRCSFDTVTLGGGVTRMYVQCGNDGFTTSHVFRSDAAQTGASVFTDLTAGEAPAGQSSGVCGSQCWYDNVVVASQEFPQIVWVAGSYDYGNCGGNNDCRGVIANNNSGASGSWFDWTWDATDNGMPSPQCCNPNQAPVVGPAPNQMHPDHHAFIVVPGTGAQLFFDGSDGGLVRSNGLLSNISSQCTGVRTADGSVSNVPLCQQMLTFVPTQLISMNQGLNTLQFMSFSVASDNQFHLMGGTQDNGTFDTVGSFFWPQIIYGDGGQSGFNQNNSFLRFNTFTGQANDANFQNGNPTAWVIIGGPIFSSPESALFYPPIIADPTSAAGSTIFEGSRGVWRTQDWGGSQGFLEAFCPEFTTSAATPFCGDFVRLGGAPGTNNAGDLEGTFYGGSRSGGNVNVIERTTSNTNVAWAASTRGRVFISTNVDTNPGANVIWNRLDPVGTKDPSRVVTGIASDPFNPFHAWVSYSGYNFNTPSQRGHIFSVSWTGAGFATWTDISNNLPDIPLTSVVFDPVTGDLYISSDFTVFRLAAGRTIWDVSGMGLPIVEVPKLTIVPGSRLIYAATHGLGGWFMSLY